MKVWRMRMLGNNWQLHHKGGDNKARPKHLLNWPKKGLDAPKEFGREGVLVCALPTPSLAIYSIQLVFQPVHTGFYEE